MNRKIFLASMMILVFAFVGCSDDDDGGTAPVSHDEFALVAPITDAYVSTYAPRDNAIHNLGMNPSASAFADAYFGSTKAPNTEEFFVIDWRSDTAYANAHIEGATNYSIQEIIARVSDASIPITKTIVNVCYTGQTASPPFKPPAGQ